jgi:myo-inositol-1(or 4)-monophosphatase
MPATESRDLARRLAFAQAACREAGQTAKAARLGGARLEVAAKGAQDWVTNVDAEVEHLLRAGLAAAYPGEPVLGEEEGGQPGRREDGTWVIDPIDGTTCFLLGIPQWCVVLAYARGGEPLVGVVYDPMADELYAAAKGLGARLNGRAIRVAAATGPQDGLIAIGAWHSARPEHSAALIARLVRDGGMFTRIGSCALALGYVACGRLLAAYEPTVCVWDDLAGMLLVREAGGRTGPYPPLAPLARHPVLAAAPGVWPYLAEHLDSALARADGT